MTLQPEIPNSVQKCFFLVFVQEDCFSNILKKVIRLQTGVEWLFIAQFELSKDLKRPDMSSFIARGPQNCPSSHEKKLLLGGINSVYKAVGSIIDCSSCTFKASTKGCLFWLGGPI